MMVIQTHHSVNGYDGDSGGGDDVEVENDMNVDESDEDVLVDEQYSTITPGICTNPNDTIDNNTNNHNVRQTRSGAMYDPNPY